MDIYLPIAHLSVNLIHLIVLGLASGILSGLYGIGGGIISVPLMIFMGIPTHIAVATSILQIVGISGVNIVRNGTSGKIKYKLALKIAAFSIIGSIVGTILFVRMQNNEYFYTIIHFLYMTLLGIVGSCITLETMLNMFIGSQKGLPIKKQKIIRHRDKSWEEKVEEINMHVYMLTGVIQRPKANPSAKNVRLSQFIKTSIIGTVIGLFSGMMGIGGGVMAMPAIMYLFGATVTEAALTSSLIAFLTTLPACILQLHSANFIDPFIAIISVAFSSYGVRLGNGIAKSVPEDYLKIMFGVLMLFIAVRFGIKIFTLSSYPYVITY